MRKLTLKNTINILKHSASAIIIDDNLLCYPSVDDTGKSFVIDLADNAEDTFLIYFCEDDDDWVKFNKEDNHSVSLKGSTITLIDSNKREHSITLLGKLHVK